MRKSKKTLSAPFAALTGTPAARGTCAERKDAVGEIVAGERK